MGGARRPSAGETGRPGEITVIVFHARPADARIGRLMHDAMSPTLPLHPLHSLGQGKIGRLLEPPPSYGLVA